MFAYVQVRYHNEDENVYDYDTYRLYISEHAHQRALQRLGIISDEKLREEIEEMLWQDNVMDIFLNGIPCNGSQVIIRDIDKDISIAIVHQLGENNEPEIAVKTVGHKLDVGNGQLSIRIYRGVAKLYRWIESTRLFKEVEVEI